MSTTRTPPFRVEYRDQTGMHVACWEDRTARPYFGLGKPTDAKAEDWRKRMNASFLAGGGNEHVTKAFGFIPHICTVRVIRQATGETVARAKTPVFEVM